MSSILRSLYLGDVAFRDDLSMMWIWRKAKSFDVVHAPPKPHPLNMPYV